MTKDSATTQTPFAPSGSSTGDASLVDCALKGDTSAYDQLIERHWDVVAAIAAARLGSTESSEDLAQEVFLRAFLSLRQLQEKDKFGSWVSRMARNLAIDWFRRGRVRSKLISTVPLDETPLEQITMQQASPREELEQSERNRLLKAALEKLTPEDRELVVLHHQEGLSQTEIAERLGVNKSTVNRRLAKALEMLKGELTTTILGEKPQKGSPSKSLGKARAALLVAAVASMPQNGKAALLLEASQQSALVSSALPTTSTTLGTTVWSGVTSFTTTLTGVTTMSTALYVGTGGAILLGALIYTQFGGGSNSTTSAANTPTAEIAAAAPVQTYDMSAPIDLIIPWGEKTSLSVNQHPVFSSITMTADPSKKMIMEVSLKAGGTLSQQETTLPFFSTFQLLDDETIEFLYMRHEDKGIQFYMEYFNGVELHEKVEQYRQAYQSGNMSKKHIHEALSKDAVKLGIRPKNDATLDEFNEAVRNFVYSSIN
jgi:RNA polymerase sigma factor (sigma-70 family)